MHRIYRTGKTTKWWNHSRSRKTHNNCWWGHQTSCELCSNKYSGIFRPSIEFVEKHRWNSPHILAYLHKPSSNTNIDHIGQSTKDNFFLWKDKDKNLVWADTKHNKHKTRCVSTNHKGQFLSMEGQGYKLGEGTKKSQETYNKATHIVIIWSIQQLSMS